MYQNYHKESRLCSTCAAAMAERIITLSGDVIARDFERRCYCKISISQKT